MAYEKQTWDTTSFVNPTRMNHIEDGIEGAKKQIIARMTPNANETIGELLARFRTEYFNGLSTNQKQFGSFRVTLETHTNMIFNCSRYGSNTSANYSCLYPTSNSLDVYSFAFGSATAVRKLSINSNGITITNITNNVAESELIFYSEDY